MHDCLTTRETAAELLRTVDDRLLAANVAGCPDCEAWCSEATAIVNILGRALDAAQPQDEYWEGYERQLFARIASESRKRMVRRLVWGFAAAVVTSIVILVIGIQERPAGIPSPSIMSVNPSQVAPESSAAAARPPNRVNRPRAVGGKGQRSSIALTFDLGRHLESVRLLLVSMKNGSDDIALDRRQARQLLERHRVLRQAVSDAGDVAAGAILDRVEPYLLDIKHIAADSPEETRWLQSRLRDNLILTLVSGYETNP